MVALDSMGGMDGSRWQPGEPEMSEQGGGGLC